MMSEQSLGHQYTSRSSSTPVARSRNSTSEPTPITQTISASQLHDPFINTRKSFKIAYNISKSTHSIATKNLAILLCRDNIAETTSRLTENQTEIDQIIEATQEQVDKIKQMEDTWRLHLLPPSETHAEAHVSHQKEIRGLVKHFEDLRMEYDRLIALLKWLEELKIERKLLLDDQKYMCGHVL